MTINKKVVIDNFTKRKIATNSLNMADYLLLFLANEMANQFKDVKAVFVGAKQQRVQTPSIFVDFYEITNRQKVDDLSQYDFGIEITYIPIDKLSRLELNSAIFSIEQNLETITTEIGDFNCYNKSSDITDGIAHVTGNISAFELTLPDDLIIKTADKELKI